MGLYILIILTAQHLTFSPQGVRVNSDGTCSLEDGVFTFEVGKPAVPGYIIHFKSMDEGSITVFYNDPMVIGEYNIPPLQPPTILSQRNVSKVEPDREVYKSSEEYPGRKFEVLKTKPSRRGYIGTILIYPLQYRPKDKLLVLYQDVTLEGNISLLDEGLITTDFLRPEEAGYEYLIITSEYLAPYFEPLAQWKNQKGIPSRIVTTEDIYSSCEGRDNQEKIRGFIKSQHEDSSVVWVLLGGDTDVVPARIAYAFECGAGGQSDEDSIPCDLYYSDLDGSWDCDGDSTFGEVEDSVDMMPDVIVGRAPVNSMPEAQNFIGKLLTYERDPPIDYLTDALFFAMIMWDDPFTDGGVHKDMIESDIMPPHFSVTKLFERDGNGDAEGVIDSINIGRHILNHTGHGWIDVIAMYPGWIRNWDMDDLTNGNRLGILYSIGCWTGALDYDCIGEHYVNARDGGGVAYIGNSRYGWGSPGNPGYGYSEIFDSRFFKHIFVDSIVNIGAALASSKAFYVPLAEQGNVYRWCEYQINLLGDPEMPVWTDTPVEVTAVYPDSIPVGEFSLPILVLYADGTPIEDARVVFMGDDYQKGWTNSNGELVLSIYSNTPGSAQLTITGRNLIPYVDSIYVFDDGANLSLVSHHTDKEPGPGDTVTLFCSLRNFGSETSEEQEVTLTTFDTLTTIIDGLDTLRQIEPYGMDTLRFVFCVDESAENGHLMRFGLADIGEFGEMVRSAILVLKDVYKNGPVGPGDAGLVFLGLKNTGYGTARGISINVSPIDSFIEFYRSGTYIDSLLPDSSITVDFEFYVRSDCPSLYVSKCLVDYGEIDTFSVAIGCWGLVDDFEGYNGWYATGSWHIDRYRSYSPDRSFYCGDSLIREYADSLCDSLISPPFYVDENSRLSFWHWFDMVGLEDLGDPGCDGLYIGVLDSSDFHLLDFVGSGGALDSAYNSCPYWLKSTYDLSFIPAGREIRVFFKFISNGSRSGEGWYIDDVCVQPNYLSVEDGISEVVLFQNFPNPFVYQTRIPYRIKDRGRMCIYDISGRIVRLFENLDNDGSPLCWDGQDEAGRILPAGIYFCRLEEDGVSLTRKILKLR